MNAHATALSSPSPAASGAAGRWATLRRAWWRHIGPGLALLAAVAGAYLFISRFFVQSVQVVGTSMQPTLHNGQRLLLNRWILHFRDPQRGDIVVFRDPQAHGFSVKRVVAVAGDSLYLRDGPVYLNGHRLKEPYLPVHTPTYPPPKVRDESLRCGKGEFILLGDNRNNSTDSRYYGPVPRSRIVGLLR